MSMYYYFMLDNYYDKHHNHCLQPFTVKLLYTINNHLVSGESIIDFTLLLTATI